MSFPLQDLNPRLLETCDLLSAVVERLSYKDWRFNVALFAFNVTITVADSRTGAPIDLTHSMTMPHKPLRDEAEARRWVLERVFDIERHEAMELFLIDGAAVFFPDHSAPGNPYVVNENPKPVTPLKPYRNPLRSGSAFVRFDESYGMPPAVR